MIILRRNLQQLSERYCSKIHDHPQEEPSAAVHLANVQVWQNTGGIALLLYKKGRGVKVEKIDVRKCEGSEVVMAE
ncbi:hypothetical protein E2C01_097354 [Portunus trituberculatus]|uniref:Uncharacterized protein n=1 Tax=Portunus trituberculatus TaxID=210409 RepID=A0A5B7K9Q7_PORTR|nr:hypothetical protein [Portunus trituberculatus]